MKTDISVVGYSRISTEDQSNFSLDGQEEQIRKHCQHNGWKLVDIFTDNGQSAKNFDRADWKQLEKFLKANHKNIDYLVVMKYDRFSRNLPDALNMINKLETSFGVKIVSVMEPIGIPPESPFFFQLRTQLLLNAHVELLVIRDRTKFGMHQAAVQGRWVRKAPFGYRNGRDDENKPILHVELGEAKIVEEIFDLWNSGVSQAEILRIVRPKGFIVLRKDAITKLVARPLYAGYIEVPEYKGEPARLAKSINPAIIPEAVYWKAQSLLNPIKKERVAENPEIPLKGSLRCHCGKLFTAGRSKGKTKYYWYYECPTHRKLFNANVVHDKFNELLKALTLPLKYLDYIYKAIPKQIEQRIKANSQLINQLQKDVKEIETKIDSLEEKYIISEIDSSVYKKWKSKYENEKFALLSRLDEFSKSKDELWAKYKRELHQVGDLSAIYSKATLGQKRAFINIVFDNKLWFDGCTYRTPYLLDVFRWKAHLLKEKSLLIYEQALDFLAKVADVRQRRFELPRPVTGATTSR